MLIIYDYTPLLEELKKLSIKYNICFPRIKYVGYWDPNNNLDGHYIIPDYGIIEFKEKYNS